MLAAGCGAVVSGERRDVLCGRGFYIGMSVEIGCVRTERTHADLTNTRIQNDTLGQTHTHTRRRGGVVGGGQQTNPTKKTVEGSGKTHTHHDSRYHTGQREIEWR